MKKVVAEDIRSVLNKMNTIVESPVAEKSGDPQDETGELIANINKLNVNPPQLHHNGKYEMTDILQMLQRLVQMTRVFQKLIETYDYILTQDHAKNAVLDLQPALNNLLKILEDSIEMAKKGQLEDRNGVYNAIHGKMGEFGKAFDEIKNALNNEWKSDKLNDFPKFVKSLYGALRQIPQNIEAFQKKLDVVRQTDFKKQHAHVKNGNIQGTPKPTFP